MRIGVITCLLLILSFDSNSQIKGTVTPGTFTSKNGSHNNRYHYEELNLLTDSTFKYSYNMKFIKLNLQGTWRVDGNQLILCSNNSKEGKMEIMEKTEIDVPENHLRFDVKDFNKERINYSILINSGDTTIILKNRYGTTDVPFKRIDSFQIIGSTYHYPLSELPSKYSNMIDVYVNQKRIIEDEKWAIIDCNRIRPIGLDNKPASYFLLRED